MSYKGVLAYFFVILVLNLKIQCYEKNYFTAVITFHIPD